MIDTDSPVVLITKIILMYFILPGVIAGVISWFMRKKNIIKDGDMLLELKS